MHIKVSVNAAIYPVKPLKFKIWIMASVGKVTE